MTDNNNGLTSESGSIPSAKSEKVGASDFPVADFLQPLMPPADLPVVDLAGRLDDMTDLLREVVRQLCHMSHKLNQIANKPSH